MKDFDLTGEEVSGRRRMRLDRAEARRYQHQQDMISYHADLRAGRFSTFNPTPLPRLPWDGVKNSQIQPITH